MQRPRSYYVGRGAQGRGVGSALVQHAVREAPRLGKRVLFGILLERNHASIRLMEKCGFELWGRLPDVALIDRELVSHLWTTGEECDRAPSGVCARRHRQVRRFPRGDAAGDLADLA